MTISHAAMPRRAGKRLGHVHVDVCSIRRASKVNAAKRTAKGGQYSKKRRQRSAISKNMPARMRKKSGRESRRAFAHVEDQQGREAQGEKDSISGEHLPGLERVPLAADVDRCRIGQQHVHVVKNQKEVLGEVGIDDEAQGRADRCGIERAESEAAFGEPNRDGIGCREDPDQREHVVHPDENEGEDGQGNEFAFEDQVHADGEKDERGAGIARHGHAVEEGLGTGGEREQPQPAVADAIFDQQREDGSDGQRREERGGEFGSEPQIAEGEGHQQDVKQEVLIDESRRGEAPSAAAR